MRLKLCFICQASNEIGYGHLTRTCNFINEIKHRKEVDSIDLYVISENIYLNIEKRYLLQPIYINSEEEIIVGTVDFVFLDCISLSDRFLKSLKYKHHVKTVISLSPVFNNYNYVDFLFTRSTYKDTSNTNKSPVNIKVGPQYSILGHNLTKTNAGRYEENLMSPIFSIGISMGATDPLNMTKSILTALSNWKQSCLIWIAVGDGYEHNIHDLKDITMNDSKHELVIVSTNDSFWSVFQNTTLLILQGGVTTYEAAFCGIPCINIPRSADHKDLTSDLIQRKLSWSIENFNENNYSPMLDVLDGIYKNKSILMDIHFRLKNLIDNKGPQRIMDVLLNNNNG
jgi:spore coat polysaccharide biosynthesis predicted glycosyltransferase SpsG